MLPTYQTLAPKTTPLDKRGPSAGTRQWDSLHLPETICAATSVAVHETMVVRKKSSVQIVRIHGDPGVEVVNVERGPSAVG